MLDKKFQAASNEKYFEEMENLYSLLKDTSLDKNDPATANSEKYFLVSTYWISQLFIFIENLKKYKNTENFEIFFENAFNCKHVLAYYFQNEDLEKISGFYPGPVNNFFISKFKDHWFDPLESESHTNIYIQEGMKENTDFFYLDQKKWDLLKKHYGEGIKIERKVADLSGSTMIEVYLRKVIIPLILV